MGSALHGFRQSLRHDDRVRPRSGDCGIVALILEGVLNGELYGLYNHTACPDTLPAHFVIKANDTFHDGVGSYSETELRTIWRNRFQKAGRRREINRPDYVAPEPVIYIDRMSGRFESRANLYERMSFNRNRSARILKKAEQTLSAFDAETFLNQSNLPLPASMVDPITDTMKKENGQ